MTYILRNWMDLPRPDVQSTCTLDSESVVQGQNGLVHSIKLPKVGEYIYEFKLWSNYAVKPNMQSTDSIISYIDSVHLCLDSPNNPISQINLTSGYGHGPIPHLALGVNLSFLPDLPLIVGALTDTDVYIVINFRKPPTMRYYLSYEVGIIANESLKYYLNTCFTIPGQISRGHIIANSDFRYWNGRLSIV